MEYNNATERYQMSTETEKADQIDKALHKDI